MERTKINKLQPNTEIKICGFIEKIRDQKYMQFVLVRDNSGMVQVTVEKETLPEIAKVFTGLLQYTVVEVIGKCIENKAVKQGGIEIIPSKVNILSRAELSPIDEESGIDSRLDYRWIDLRNEKKFLTFKIQSYMTECLRSFLVERDFIEIHTPKLIATASESGADVFEVKYFDGKAYLAQSPQFYKQMAMSAGFERIFECGPVFRAENSNTNRHATEFTGFDLEFSYIESYEDVMKFEEELLCNMLSKMKEKFGEEIKRVFGVEVKVPTLPFPRIDLATLFTELEKEYGYKVPKADQVDLPTEGEKLAYQYVSEKYGHEFVFVTGYPAKKRAFYHMRKNGVLQGYDLIWKGVEITTGAQREHRYEELKKQAEEKGLAKDVEFYLQFFKYGCPPHGGMGLGMDRMIMILLNINSIKEAQFIFRGPNKLTP